MQAQDARGARLAIRARSRGLAASDVDRALGKRKLVVSWLNRGTLHLVRAEDYPWLHALTVRPLLAVAQRRLQAVGVSASVAEKAAASIRRALAHGPRTREELREALTRARLRIEGEQLMHLLFFAATRGACVRGPVSDGEPQFVLVEDWLGPQPPVDRDRALEMLARRYLRGHGPATPRDLAKWAGLTIGDARRAFGALGNAIEALGDGSVDLKRKRNTELPAPRLLGPFDPLLHGWESREPVVGEHERRVVTTNGIFRPIALVDGRAVATWRIGAKELEPFDRLARAEREALRAEAEDVRRFLGT